MECWAIKEGVESLVRKGKTDKKIMFAVDSQVAILRMQSRKPGPVELPGVAFEKAVETLQLCYRRR
jgi:hypothetical protein